MTGGSGSDTLAGLGGKTRWPAWAGTKPRWTALQFEAGPGGAATGAVTRFIHQTITGLLFDDADGSGAGAAVRIASFSGVPAVGAADIDIIA